MNLDALTTNPRTSAAPMGLVEAVVASTPASGEAVDVLIGAQLQLTGPCDWTPVVIDGALYTPARGDRCFVERARKGEVVVIWWEPGDDRAGIVPTTVATDMLWDAKGDLAVGTGADAAIRKAVGADDTLLTANAAAPGGIAWSALDPTLVALAGLATGANKIPYSTGSDAFSQTDFVPMTAYTPAWTSSGSTPSLGNGTLNGLYQRLGNVVDFTITLTFGSSTSPGTGVYNFSLPIAASGSSRWVGHGDVLDFGAQHYSSWWLIAPSGTTFSEILWSSTAQTGTNVQANSPVPFGDHDQITLSGRYGV